MAQMMAPANARALYRWTFVANVIPRQPDRVARMLFMAASNRED